MNGCLKSWENDLDFVFGSNKKPSKPTKSRMNLLYLNKNISKCTIYIKQLDSRVVYKKTITVER